jgi:hypothetical protein
MCKACDGPPYEKAKYQFPSVDDWEDPKYRHTKRRKHKGKGFFREPKGCPANDHKAHVYVIVKALIRSPRWVRNEYGFDRTVVDDVEYRKKCVGCGKFYTRYWSWHRHSPVGREFNEEDIYAEVDERKSGLWSAMLQ